MELIKQEIRLWSKTVLEKPCAGFGGLPACPFAKKAWLDEKVRVHVTDNLQTVIDLKNQFDPEFDGVDVIAWTAFQSMTPNEFDKWVLLQNVTSCDVWIMGFHPDSEDDALTEEFEALTDLEYAIILVQSLEHLVSASDRLVRTGYYKSFSNADKQFISERNSKCVA